MKKHYIFSIETSCDETSAAILACSRRPKKNLPSLEIMAHTVYSQIEEHQKTFGIVPEVAARHHVKKIIPVVQKTIQNFESTQGKKDCTQKLINAVAVTAGPGLVTSLQVGMETAKALSLAWHKPIIAINHLEGHIFSSFLEQAQKGLQIRFPVLALIVSGGHTELVLMKNFQKRQLIGQTRDDAVGEAFDKVAKLLQLGYPGGPIISNLAEKGTETAFNFPRPMRQSNNFDMSFSGLKTAVLYTVDQEKIGNLRRPTFTRKKMLADICASFQRAVIDVLIQKSLKAATKYRVKSFILSGGVAANKQLRHDLKKALESHSTKLDFYLPSRALATDNAAMIAAAASLKLLKGDFDNLKDVNARPDWGL